jgi:hypothetical protein
MSETTTNTASDDTLIRDSQLSGFSAFKERLGYCCCRLFKKTSSYNLSSVSKDIENQPEKPSYVNQAFQVEKQARKDKLEKIAKTLPGGTSNGIRTSTPVTQTPTRALTTITQGTPRSGINVTQTRPKTGTPTSKTAISTLHKPSPLAANTKTNKKDTDETTTGLLLDKF